MSDNRVTTKRVSSEFKKIYAIVGINGLRVLSQLSKNQR